MSGSSVASGSFQLCGPAMGSAGVAELENIDPRRNSQLSRISDSTF
jgi:hypothetical protein